MAQAAKKTKVGKHKRITIQEKDKFLPRLTTLFFDRPRLTAVLWLAVALFGVACYTTLLKREGFPSVQIPIAIVTGVYAPNEAAVVDEKLAKPIADTALQQDGVGSVQTESADNFMTATIQYKEGTDASAAVKKLEQTIQQSGQLPEGAQVRYNVPYFGATGGDVEKLDLAVSFYAPEKDVSVADLQKKAQEAAEWLNQKDIPGVEKVFVKSAFETTTNPATGQQVTVQRSFDRYGSHENNDSFHRSIIIGVSAEPGSDVLKVHDHVQGALHELADQEQFQDYEAAISASFAPSIRENISELQKVLIEGLLAVLVVGSIVIAVRASIITVISMITVLVTSIGFLFLIGYTLNVITLFALILGLALIVDDTIIMVEAIDAARKREKDARQAVKVATRKVSRAMVAATLTACLSFAPLLFVSGILGTFIRAIPVTIIASLLISLLVALIFIPFFARFLLLGKKQMGPKAADDEIAAGFEAKLANFIARPMMWAQHSRRKLFGVGMIAVIIGFGFVVAGGLIARNVTFNIFPKSKDTNAIVLQLLYPQGTSIEQAERIAAQVEDMAKGVIGENFEHGTYYSSGSSQSAALSIELKAYDKREITSPEIVEQLQEKFSKEFREARVVVAQVDLGPPAATFGVDIWAEDREAAFRAANDIAAFMSSTTLERIDGTTAKMTNVTVSSADEYIRTGSDLIVRVSSGFDAGDTSTLVNLAQQEITDEFDAEKLKSYGLDEDDLQFELGQEAENQESFNTLLLAFPVLLVAMYVLLAVQFRSLLQPLLIFLAIPFSLFGVMLGLYLTDNAISFFTMLGFFALIGLSIKNTILLTDYANQARRAQATAVEAAHAAIEERFRPLFATSMTAVVSLIPLAISSPFWEGLAVVLIFGLLSSTFLVLTVFPYYYLGAEYLRLTFGRLSVVLWFTTLLIGAGLLVLLDKANLIGFWIVIGLVWPFVYMYARRLRGA